MDNPIGLYDNLFFSKEFECAIFQLKKGKVFFAKENSIKELDITKIIESQNNQVRYFNRIEGKKKWGVIHISGFEIIPPMYDYISALIDSKYYKVFNGDYLWEFDDDSFDYFAEHIDTNSWNGDEYIGTLKNGQWGLVEIEYDMRCTILIPPEFRWLILVDKKIVCCNVGGSLIKWHNGDGKEDIFEAFGGLWKVIEASKWDNRVETELGTFSEVIEKFKSEYSKQFVVDYTYEYQFIFDPQKIY